VFLGPNLFNIVLLRVTIEHGEYLFLIFNLDACARVHDLELDQLLVSAVANIYVDTALIGVADGI
jgi:hypothetical protein